MFTHQFFGSILHRFGHLDRREEGQASAEYALVLLGAAAVAVLVVTWATGTDKVGDLLDAVVESILSNVR